MSLELYTPDYSNRYEISHAISVQMSFYYNDIGKLTLVLPVNDYNIAALKNNSIVYDTKKKIAYIIKNVKSVVVPNTGGLRGLAAAAAARISRSSLMSPDTPR